MLAKGGQGAEGGEILYPSRSNLPCSQTSRTAGFKLFSRISATSYVWSTDEYLSSIPVRTFEMRVVRIEVRSIGPIFLTSIGIPLTSDQFCRLLDGFFSVTTFILSATLLLTGVASDSSRGSVRHLSGS